MQKIKKDFNQRIAHAKEYYSFLSFIDSNSDLTRCKIAIATNELEVSSELLKILKSTCYLILYNAIESAIYNCTEKIHSTIETEKISYGEASGEIQNLWSRCCPSKNIKEIIDQVITNEPIIIEKKLVNISGSIDVAKIREIQQAYGLHGPIVKTRSAGDSFLRIKNRRNKLAHGEVTFTTASNDTTVSELQTMIQDVESYLSSFLELVCDYLNETKFKNRTPA